MKLAKGFAASILIHVFFFLSVYYMIMWWKNSSFSAINIDLSGSSLLLRPSKNINKNLKLVNPDPDWFISENGKFAALPVKTTVTAAPVEPAAPPCPAPCPDNPADWSSVGATSRRPVWLDGLIEESDYPKELRAQGKEGRVKVEVYIDASGTVRDVHVIDSNDSRFTAVVTDKLKKAKFSPAMDKDGKPIAVHMAIPIIFELH